MDEMRNLFWNGIWKKYVAILVIWAFFLFIAWLLNATWPHVIGLILIIAFIVVPHITKIHRGYAGQICSECSKPVGAFETHNMGTDKLLIIPLLLRLIGED